MEYVIFFVLAAVAVFGALNMVLRTNPVIAALNLILAILAMAGLYLTLNAEFLAAVQIIVYAGAIMILFLFVVLLINVERELWEDFSLFRLPAPVLGVVLACALIALVWTADIPMPAEAVSPDPGSGKEVGKLLFTEWSLAFEVASVILFAGMVGAVILARGRRVD